MSDSSISFEEEQQLKEWLGSFEIHIRRPSREFADATQMALLLKRLYPRLVELNNYPSRFSFSLKLSNWKLLNSKVLSRLNFTLSDEVMEKLASGKSNVIKTILFSLMTYHNKEKERRRLSRSTSITSLCFDGKNPDFAIVNVNKEIDGELQTVPQKMIAYHIFKEERKENKEKTAQIDKLKNEIHELKEKLEEIIPTSSSSNIQSNENAAGGDKNSLFM